MKKADDKMVITCLKCGKMLMKCKGNCVLDVLCRQCGSMVRIVVEEEEITLKEIKDNL